MEQQRLSIEIMETEARLVSAAAKIVDQLLPDEREAFLQRFNAEGWNVRPMREALMHALEIVSKREATRRKLLAGLAG